MAREKQRRGYKLKLTNSNRLLGIIGIIEKLSKVSIMDDKRQLNIGQKLRALREASSLSTKEVATSLRLSQEFIELLENEAQTDLPPAYIKGYLRAYAKLLAMSDNDLALYFLNQEDCHSASGWEMYAHRKQMLLSNKYLQWLVFITVTILLLLVTLWWKSDKLLHSANNGRYQSEQDYVMGRNEL